MFALGSGCTSAGGWCRAWVWAVLNPNGRRSDCTWCRRYIARWWLGMRVVGRRAFRICDPNCVGKAPSVVVATHATRHASGSMLNDGPHVVLPSPVFIQPCPLFLLHIKQYHTHGPFFLLHNKYFQLRNINFIKGILHVSGVVRFFYSAHLKSYRVVLFFLLHSP